MADVAKRAGVSPATVARVLYSNGYVTAEKRTLVERAVRDIGYRPNAVARALRTSRSFTMGMVVSESRLNAFHSLVAHEVQVEALKHGYTVLTLNNNDSDAVERTGVQRFLDQHVDAVVFCAARDPANVHLIAQAGVPTVQIEREVAQVGDLVLVDPRPGMIEAVDHLRRLDHKSIAYIGGGFDVDDPKQSVKRSAEALRLNAFEAAMTAAGLVVEPGLVLLGSYYLENSLHQPGYTHMRTILGRPDRPTAVIAGADLLAATALQAINETGLRVPEDISLIGYDDTIAEILTPPLTSIAQPIVELGRKAVRSVLQAIQAPEMSARSECLPTHLVVRTSTARPR